jgi:alpha/beta superfamily hydrolase
VTLHAEPTFFGPESRRLAGWLHRPAGSARDGVVLCNPFGYEAICAHRSLRHFAEAIAESGLPALRFDYDGTGDSAGDDLDPGRLAAWVESTREAVRTLREACAVERVWLLGVRLGVLVAVLAAEGLDVSGVIAVAPVVSGRAYLRELKLLQTALGLGEPPAGHAAGAPGEGAQEALGFVLTAETCAALTKVDIAKLPHAPAKEVLVLDRDDLPGAAKWVAQLESLGVHVDARRMRGYVEMVLDPHKAEVPEQMVGATTAWLSARAAAGDGAASPRKELAAAQAEGGGVIERPVFIDEQSRLFGVLSAPSSARPSGRAVLLLNAGAIHHIGPNRLHVALARTWAAAGDHVLRLDLSGIGDSPARTGEPENAVYGARALEDIGAAVRWLRRLPAVESVWSVGLCSGAYHALKGAVAGHEVAGIVAINPLTFFWTPDASLDFPAFKVTEDAERYQRAAFDPEKWKKVLRGEVDVRRAAETVGRRVLQRASKHARDLSRRVHLPWKNDVGAELNALAKRSVAIRFVFAGGDPGQQLLADEGGSAVVGLRKRGHLSIDEIAGADHTFTPVWSHRPLGDVLTLALDSHPRPRR